MSDYGSPPPPPPPSYGAAGAQDAPPPNYLVWAILSTILCCPPVGIPSIVFSTQVNSKWAMGDVAGAYAASEKAKSFAIYAVVAGVVGTVLYVIVMVVLAMGANSASGS